MSDKAGATPCPLTEFRVRVGFNGTVTVRAQTLGTARAAIAAALSAGMKWDDECASSLSRSALPAGVRLQDVKAAVDNVTKVEGAWLIASGASDMRQVAHRRGQSAAMPLPGEGQLIHRKHVLVDVGRTQWLFEVEYSDFVDVDQVIDDLCDGLKPAMELDIFQIFLTRFQTDDIRVSVVTNVEYRTT